jgi:hypothetical protein
MLQTPPILSALIELAPRALRLLWRDPGPDEARASVSWTGRAWQTVTSNDAPIALIDGEEVPALRVREDAKGQEWTVPVIDSSGRTCWERPRFATYSDALAALLDFPIRPAEAADDGDGADAEDEDRDARTGVTTSREPDEKRYALHAAAEMIERVAALQQALPTAMLDDWLDHLDRMLHATFPAELVAEWRAHRIDPFAHLREPELRPKELSGSQRVRYVAILDEAARAWGLR